MSSKIERTPNLHGVGNAVIDVNTDATENPGGSACNFTVQTALFEIASTLHAAVGFDSDGDKIIDELHRTGVSTAGVYRKGTPTARNTHTVDALDPDTTIMTSSEYHAGQQHTLSDIKTSLGSAVAPGDIVYFAGLGRRSIIDHPQTTDGIPDNGTDKPDPYAFEELLSYIDVELGATVAIDPGRPPKPNDPRHYRASTLLNYAQNTGNRIKTLGLNDAELSAYFGVSPEVLRSNALTQPMLDRILHDGVMANLADRDIHTDPSLLFCLTLGSRGLYLSNLEHSTFIGVPPLAENERRTYLGLGDSTKAGMLKALIHETQGVVNPDTITNLTADQLRRIAAIGSAASTYRMKYVAYSNLEQLAELVDDRSEHFAPLGVTSDYVRSL